MTDAVNQQSGCLPGLCAVADALPNATLIIDRQGVIAVANTMVSKTLAISDDCSLEGKSSWQVLPEGLRELVAAMQREVLIYASDAHRDFELPLPGAESKLLELHLAPVTGNSGQPTHFCLVITDASARQQVAELQKLDVVKSNFLAMISHELRTPLTSIRGAVHLLAETEPCKSESACALVDIIHSNSERLIRLVNNLLEMVAIDNNNFTVTKQRVYIAPLVRQALVRHEATAQAKFISLNATDDNAVSSVDTERFVQLVSYLVENAIKFTPHGGKITVSVHQQPNGPMQLTVSDTGCGVPQFARDKIFDKFFQVEDAMTRCCGGAGVGLYLARHIVQLHGGQIWVDVNPSGGSDFIATFPAAESSAQDDPVPVSSAPAQ
jgi:signal transduction histidine kinase